ncbi:MAG: hypothetical protein LBN29_06290 [Mediterranea sp.]|jgi:hypothetical protein|nr:hypothetical protein [Mediterranea sp.]
MKTTVYTLFIAVLAALGLSGCASEDHGTVNGNALPSVSDVKQFVDVIVDQETNEVTFEYTGPGSYPIWIVNNGTNTIRSTKMRFVQVFTKAGTYTYELKLGNKNGISDGSFTDEFTIDNTLMDLATVAQLCGTESKVWVWNSRVAGHFGCGEPGTEGLNWWSAPAEDKKDWGMYDDTFTFNVDGTYTYNPGEGGTILVNTGVTQFPAYNTNDGQDFMVPVEPQTSTWEMEYDGDKLNLVFPARTLVGYISADPFYEAPRFRIVSISNNKLVLASIQADISWHFEFIPKDVFDAGDISIVGSWTWDSSFKGHFGCGPTPASPVEWWSANPDEKADWGVYDDVLTFKADGTYIFNPGPDGEIYVNTGCTLFPDFNTNDGADFDVPVSEQTSTYQIVEEGAASFIVLPAETYFTYLSGDYMFQNPKFQILKMTADELQVASTDPGIAWMYSFKRIP